MESILYSAIESGCILEEGLFKLIVNKGRASYGSINRDHDVIAIMTGLGGEYTSKNRLLVDFAGFMEVHNENDILIRGTSGSCVNRIENNEEATLHAAEVLSGILMKNIRTPFTKQT
jgi:hypothetical protein